MPAAMLWTCSKRYFEIDGEAIARGRPIASIELEGTSLTGPFGSVEQKGGWANGGKFDLYLDTVQGASGCVWLYCFGCLWVCPLVSDLMGRLDRMLVWVHRSELSHTVNGTVGSSGTCQGSSPSSSGPILSILRDSNHHTYPDAPMAPPSDSSHLSHLPWMGGVGLSAKMAPTQQGWMHYRPSLRLPPEAHPPSPLWRRHILFAQNNTLFHGGRSCSLLAVKAAPPATAEAA